MAKSRIDSAPEIPTVDEAGLPGLYMSTWTALFAPKGTDKAIIAKLEDAALKALADASVRERLAKVGQDVFPPDQRTAAFLAKYQDEEIRKWWPIIKEAGVKPE
jgi:tripartite-type tricarboxylate transporter receptor subunit TctC